MTARWLSARARTIPGVLATTSVVMAPGSTTELTFNLLGPGNVDGIPDDITPELMLTPGIEPWLTSVESYRDCRVAVK